MKTDIEKAEEVLKQLGLDEGTYDLYFGKGCGPAKGARPKKDEIRIVGGGAALRALRDGLACLRAMRVLGSHTS